ncbi:relaxase/mobilization nuclease domain-containing protein [Vallicoccus soli]|uniref:Relaxase n=1 Tax=Vallicoccus soli TaxID=2339232 RepID=A0A3A3ZJU3_9ACTN|nr:relaxase [Vallicoccus soli]RJK95939.1 relaxase [Vallicoccus soli]
MIGKIVRGSDVAGLLRYLYGPGRANEHTDPHLVGAWDDPQLLEPAVREGRHDVRRLANLLEQPLQACPRPPANPVWHCALRVAPTDPRLSDGQWGAVAREVLDRTGLVPPAAGASPEDIIGCRWVAVRHAEDHIHLVVTLAREDGRPARPSNDYYRVGRACRDLEDRYHLVRTAPRDRTAPRRPTRAETEKAARHARREAPRLTLRREVRIAAAGATSTEDFLDRLRNQGLLIRERHSRQHPALRTGYAVAWPGDHDDRGQPVWFGGSKLAPDLALPRLERRWARRGPNPRTADAVARREDVHVPAGRGQSVKLPVALFAQLRRLERELHHHSFMLREPDGLAALHDLLQLLARAVEGTRGGLLTDAVDNLHFRGARPDPDTRSTADARALQAFSNALTHHERGMEPSAAALWATLLPIVRRHLAPDGHKQLGRAVVGPPPTAPASATDGQGPASRHAKSQHDRVNLGRSPQRR